MPKIKGWSKFSEEPPMWRHDETDSEIQVTPGRNGRWKIVNMEDYSTQGFTWTGFSSKSEALEVARMYMKRHKDGRTPNNMPQKARKIRGY